MADLRISELTSGGAAQTTDEVPVSRTATVATRKVTAAAIAALGGGPPAAHKTSHQDGGTDEISVTGLSGQLADAQKVTVRKNSGADIGTRARINFIEGTNITFTIADDGTEIDVTAAASGGGGTPGGADTQVQFNDSGAFGGDTALTWNKTTDTLTTKDLVSTGQVLQANGTETAPGQSWSSSPSTGWYLDSGLIGLSFSGTNRMFMSPSGVVLRGNGTDGPILRLEQVSVFGGEAAFIGFTSGASAPSTPIATANAVLWHDGTTKNMFFKGSDGVVKHGVQTKAAVANNFLTAIADDGAVTTAQPSFSNLSGSISLGQLVAHASTHQDGGSDELSVTGLSGLLVDAQKVTVRKNSGADIGTRSRLNFIEGTNITFTIADDGTEIDITAAASGGAGGGTVTHTVGALTLGQVVVGNGTDDIKVLASPSDATQFLNGAAIPAFAAVKDSDLSTSDITTNNVSISKHGFAPKLPNDATKYLDGTGAYTVPPSGGGSGTVTNTGTLTDHGLIVGNGGVDVSALAAATNGQIPIGSTGADPVLAVPTGAGSVTVAGSAGGLTITGNRDVQEFLASGTWTKPTTWTPSWVMVIAYGAGGGGGSGRCGAAGAARTGGSGGGGGAYAVRTYRASDLGATEGVTVGAGGSAGGAVGVAASDGNAGNPGGSSIFGTGSTPNRLTVFGGGGGAGGAATARSAGTGGGSAGVGQVGSGAGVNGGLPNTGTGGGISGGGAGSSGTGVAGTGAEMGGASGGGSINTGVLAGGGALNGGSGGGGGGGLTVGNAESAGGAGGIGNQYTSGGGVAGGAARTNGNPGVAGDTTRGGGGGSGGGSSNSNAVNGGTGGAGAQPGGAGGGGGCTTAAGSAVSGAGGAGGDGAVYVVTW